MMKTTLLRPMAVAVFCLFAAVFAQGQRVPVKVKQNERAKVTQIKIEYQLRGSTAWLPAFLGVYVPSDAVRMRFNLDLAESRANRIRSRLELRQICNVLLNGEIEISRELLLFASDAPLVGKDVDVDTGDGGRKFRLVIQTDPPEGSLDPKAQPHCAGNSDHLGEGPYQAFIFTGDSAASSLLDGNDTLNLNYTQEFETLSRVRFDRLRLRVESTFAPKPRMRRRGRRR
jgi:hypothetical protein